MLPLLILLFIVVPIAELYVIIQVGQTIGALPTIAILIADSVIGSMLLRAQGRGAWRRFQRALAEGRVPAREVLDGALVIFGGAFLITPGFITDVVGVLLLLPPTRAVVRRMLVGIFSRRFVVSLAGAALAEGEAEVADPVWTAIEVAGVRMEILEPLREWRVTATAAGDGFDLRFTAACPPIELGADDPAARLGGMEGYEQLCRVEGSAK